ncbi:MAG: hypothetical protein VYD57_08420 [Pseudomonadota bacterium]|nr:hypothetical protein [Pseudomonadota bacterium]
MRYAPNRRAKLGFAALASAAVLTVSAAGSAFSQSPTPPQMPNAAAQSDAASPAGREGANRRGGEQHAWNGHHGKHGGKHHGRRGGRGPMLTPAAVAAGLATLETGIGITPEQMGPWRDFTGAAVAFAEAVQPPMRGPGGRRGKDDARMMPSAEAEQGASTETDGEADAVAPTDGPDGAPIGSNAAGGSIFPFANKMADRAIAAGEAGQRLKSAMTNLDGALTAEQKETAHRLVRSMMREARDHRRGDHEGPRHHRGDRG